MDKQTVREVLNARKDVLSMFKAADINRHDFTPEQFTEAVTQYINSEFDLQTFLVMVGKDR